MVREDIELDEPHTRGADAKCLRGGRATHCLVDVKFANRDSERGVLSGGRTCDLDLLHTTAGEVDLIIVPYLDSTQVDDAAEVEDYERFAVVLDVRAETNPVA